MQVKSFTFNTFQENTYIVYDETKECLIIDPGCYTNEEKNTLKKFITDMSLNPVKLVNTHCHIDHILGNQFVNSEWKIKLHIHKEDIPLLEKAESIAHFYGFNHYEESPSPEHLLNHNETITFGKSNMKILFTPGHAPGHICLYSKENNILISGDVIFKNSIGRTDLPLGNYDVLMNSIKREILTLPNKTQIFCGHGPTTNLELEKTHNPFLNI